MRVLTASILAALLAAGVAGATGTTVYYRLYHLEGAVWVQYYPGDAFPVGGNLPGSNRWRYVYQVNNVSAPGSVNTFYTFFNSDGVRRAEFPPSGSGAPGGWTPTYMAPPAGAQAWRERFRGLATPIPVGGILSGFQVEFTWNDARFPGAQPYDAQFPTCSETGTTAPFRRPVPAAAVTWGGLRHSYNR